MKLRIFLFAMFLAACGGSGGSADKSTVGNTGTADTTSQPEPAPATTPVDCANEIMLTCPAGQVDGCNAGVTSFHACVDEGTAAGPPCEQEIAKVCPAGQVDGCLHTPQLSTTHVCVVP